MTSFVNLIFTVFLVVSLALVGEARAQTLVVADLTPVSGSTIDFGNVQLGQSSTQNILIRCNEACTSIVYVTAPGNTADVTATVILTNEFGGDGYVKLVWTPTTLGQQSAVLSFILQLQSAEHNGFQAGNYTVTINTTSPPAPPVITAVPAAGSTINFGDVTVGQTAVQNITLSCPNCTTSFTFETNDPGLPFSLEHVSQTINELVLSLKFTPLAPGNASVSVAEFAHGCNDGGCVASDSTPYNLIGNGVAVVQTPPELMAQIIADFNANVQNGTIDGVGKNGKAQAARVAEFDNRLDKLSGAINKGRIDQACKLIARLIVLSDGNNVKPERKDIIQGSSVAALNAELVQLQGLLGCAVPASAQVLDSDQ